MGHCQTSEQQQWEARGVGISSTPQQLSLILISHTLHKTATTSPRICLQSEAPLLGPSTLQMHCTSCDTLNPAPIHSATHVFEWQRFQTLNWVLVGAEMDSTPNMFIQVSLAVSAVSYWKLPQNTSELHQMILGQSWKPQKKKHSRSHSHSKVIPFESDSIRLHSTSSSLKLAQQTYTMYPCEVVVQRSRSQSFTDICLEPTQNPPHKFMFSFFFHFCGNFECLLVLIIKENIIYSFCYMNINLNSAKFRLERNLWILGVDYIYDLWCSHISNTLCSLFVRSFWSNKCLMFR